MGDITVYQCNACKRVLDLYQDQDGFRLQHTSQDSPADHDPVPVPLNDSVIARCDFCNIDDAVFVVPVQTFRVGVNPDGSEYSSEGDWAACSVCGLLIDSNRWTTLVARAADASDARRPDRLVNRTELARMYRKVRRNMTGPIRVVALPERA